MARSRGDLVVKFPIACPHRPRTLSLVHPLLLPPIILVTGPGMYVSK